MKAHQNEICMFVSWAVITTFSFVVFHLLYLYFEYEECTVIDEKLFCTKDKD